MKNFILVFTVLILLSCHSKNEYTISGSFTNDQSEEWIYLQKAFSEELILDSARIIEGNFQFSGKIDRPEIYALSYHWQRSKGICFFILEPGQLKIKIDPANWINMGDAVLGEMYNDELNGYLKESYRISRLNDDKAFDNFKIDYIMGHTTSPVSAYILLWTYYYLPLEKQNELLEALSPLKEMAVYKKIKKDYDNQLALKDRTPFVNNNSNPRYNELNLNDNSIVQTLVKNNPGKVLYIDSWGTSCGPCIKEFPKSNELQKKYEGKVEFIYLCVTARDENEWKDYIKKYNLSGQHYYLNNTLTEVYYDEVGSDFAFTPMYVIINKKGEMVYNNAPRPSMKETEQILDKLIE
ncbi:DUF4369 domain-containing protein [Saccharicrinis sp. FJH62]|uniref:DUF4369 domain-containing protein n=1 Tax=Saccharicrinis sp. FJH62 TaxID=3344657 RepID=UPI0035D5269A